MINFNNKINKVLVGSLLGTSLISVPFNVFAANNNTFKDIDKLSQGSQNSILTLKKEGYIGGYEDNTFRPKSQVTRAEFVSMLVSILDLKAKSKAVDFVDSKKGQWHNYVLNVAYQNGLLAGKEVKDGKVVLSPNEKISRLEMMVILARAESLMKVSTNITAEEQEYLKDYTDEKDLPSWAKKSVTQVIFSGLIGGTSYDTIGIKDKATREQSAIIGDRILKRKELYEQFANENKDLFSQFNADYKKAKFFIVPRYNVLYYAVPNEKGEASIGASYEDFEGYTRVAFGEIKNYQLQGKAIFFKDGYKYYEGNTLYSAPYGKGKEFDKDGKVLYEGNFLEGVKMGKGIVFYDNGLKKYEGDFSYDIPNGKGTYYFEDGRKYVGAFNNGQIKGQGTLYAVGGTVIKTGEFVDNELTIELVPVEDKPDLLLEDFMTFTEFAQAYYKTTTNEISIQEFNNLASSRYELNETEKTDTYTLGTSKFNNIDGYPYTVKFDKDKIEIATKGKTAKGVVKDYYIVVKDDQNSELQVCGDVPVIGEFNECN